MVYKKYERIIDILFFSIITILISVAIKACFAMPGFDIHLLMISLFISLMASYFIITYKLIYSTKNAICLSLLFALNTYLAGHAYLLIIVSAGIVLIVNLLILLAEYMLTSIAD